MCRAYERTNWEKVWEAITRRRWDGFKELYEILAVVDVRCYSLRAGCWGYHMLIALAEERLGKAEVGYIDFGETIKKSGAWRLWWGEGKDRIRGHREAIEKCSIWRLPFEGNVECISFREAIVKWSTWSLLRGQMIFGSLISRLVAINEIKCR